MEAKKAFKQIVGYAVLYIFNPLALWGWALILILALYLGCSRVSAWDAGNTWILIGALIACFIMLMSYPGMAGICSLLLAAFMIGWPDAPALVMGLIAVGLLWFSLIKTLYDDYELGIEFFLDLVECHKTNHQNGLDWMEK